ncbi:MAG: OsmC family protein [Terrimesophilobacter sp.]
MTLIDSPRPSTISSTQRAHRLAEAAKTWAECIGADPGAAQLTYRVRGTAEGSVATRITAGRHQFLVDEPAGLAGDDLAASPVEIALGALISCQVVVYRLYANALGIQVDDISIVAEGDLDARALFGIDDSVRAGFTSVRLAVTVTGSEPEERYEDLRTVVDAHCPVFDLFSNPTPVAVTLTKA